MGRLHKDDRSDPAASSLSLHSIDDDLPPPYTDEPEIFPAPQASSSARPAIAPLPIHLRLVDSAYILPDSDIKADDKRAISIAPTLSRNCDELFYAIRRQMKLPPRPLLYVKGTHTESNSNAKKGSNNSVTDFEFKLDLAETMLTGWEGKSDMGIKWVEQEVLTDEDNKPAFRGGRLKSRTYAAKSVRAPQSEDSAALLASDSVPGGDNATEQPATNNEAQLKMWCERFCNDPSPVKSFTVHRQISGFDWKAMRNVLASHIRELNYLGSVTFQYNVAHQSVTVYSPHWINRMRANRYIWWIFVILQLWIITWPVIWFMESRYELAHTRWHSSMGRDMTGLDKEYARGRDEATLGEFWAPAVKRAAWSKRCGQGNTLTRMDAERVQGLTQNQLLGLEQRTDSEAEQERRNRVNNGNGGFVDHVVGFVRGIGEVGQDWRLTVGWGGNS